MQSRSVAHALSWSAFAQIGGAVALIVGTRLLTTFVSPAVFGVVALTTGASTLMSSTFCLPILHVAGRLYPERELAGRGCVIRRATTQLILAASVFPAFIVLVLGSAYAAQGRTSLMTVIAVAFLVIVEMQRATAQTMLAAARLQREQALWAFVEQVLRPLLAVAVVLLFGDQSWLVVAAFALATAVAFVGSRFAHADTAETSSAELAAERRRLVRYAAPLLPQALSAWVTGTGDRYLLAWWHRGRRNVRSCVRGREPSVYHARHDRHQRVSSSVLSAGQRKR